MTAVSRVVCLALLCLAPLARGQDAVRFRPRLDPATPLRYEVSAEFSVRQGSGVQSPGSVLKQTAILRFAAPGEHPESGLAVRATVEALRVELSRYTSPGAEPTIITFEWTGEGEPALPENAPPAFKAYPVIVQSVADVRLRADGTLESMAGYEGAWAAARSKPSEQPRAAYLGSFSEAGAWALFESIFAIDPEGHERKPGDSWTRAELIQLSPAREAITTTKVAYAAQEGDAAKLSGEIKTEIQPPRGVPDPADPPMTIVDQRGSVSSTWDTAAGRLVERTAERFIVWEVTLDLAKPLVARDYTSSRITARLLP